jgi:hypothetical protein
MSPRIHAVDSADVKEFVAKIFIFARQGDAGRSTAQSYRDMEVAAWLDATEVLVLEGSLGKTRLGGDRQPS